MANYAKILQSFTKIGFNENSMFTEVNIKRALDQICLKNAGLRGFHPEVAKELWWETKKNNDETFTLRNYIEIITKAKEFSRKIFKNVNQSLLLADSTPIGKRSWRKD